MVDDCRYVQNSGGLYVGYDISLFCLRKIIEYLLRHFRLAGRSIQIIGIFYSTLPGAYATFIDSGSYAYFVLHPECELRLHLISIRLNQG